MSHTAVQRTPDTGEWAAEDPTYDEEAVVGLEKNLDRSRPEFREIFRGPGG